MQRDNLYNASQHFVWRQEFLGEGAFGTVFKGVHKETGELVAVKTFNRNGQRSAAQYREIDIIRRLDHQNIVRLIAIEEVVVPRRSDGGRYVLVPDSMEGKVLVMELCSEGSLFSNLERPENQFGLEESEFLLVLGHMTDGLRYLHVNKIIHRDWKPSNILKTITPGGQTVYKLCDFGAARVCDENGQFMSIVGTEEYLNPEIYRRAMLGGPNGVFAATSDLWSIGATLYQTATAMLPFRPFGGRKNKEVMHRMMTEKESGIISGYQDTENGPINYKRELPAHCLISTGLRPLLTKLLAGLLESKQASLWTYERYFREASQIFSMVMVKFYVLGEATFRTVYLDRTANFYQFRDEITAQLGSSIGEFGLFMGATFLDADNWDMQDFLREQKYPVIFVPLNDNSYRPTRLGIPLEPVFINHDRPSLDWDTDSAKISLSAAHWINVQLKLRRSIRYALFDTVAEIRKRLEKDFISISQQWPPWKFSWSLSQKQLKAIEKQYSSTVSHGLLAPKHSSACQIAQAMATQEKEMLNLKAKCMEFSKLDVPIWSDTAEKEETQAMDQMLNKIAAIYTQFRTDKAMRMDQNPETYHNELKWHALQKKQLQNYWQWCKGKMSDTEFDSFKDFVQIGATYLRAAVHLTKLVSKVELGVRNMEEIVRAFDASLDKLPMDVLPVNGNHSEISSSVNAIPEASSKQQHSELGDVDALQTLKVATSFLSMVKDIQEMRGVAQENRLLLDRFPSKS